MSIEKKWKEIGVVVGTTSTDTYEFVISDLSASVGDIVITKSSTPLTKDVLVWGRIVWMERTNPTFPSEFAAELARENLDMNETIGMSGSEHLRSEVQIMGCTDAKKSDADDIILEPLAKGQIRSTTLMPVSRISTSDACSENVGADL